MPDPTPHATSNETVETRLQKVRSLPGILRAAALKEGLLAASTVVEHETAAPYAWALLELATLPGMKPSGPSWSPLRALAERRTRVSDAAFAGIVAAWGGLTEDVKAAAGAVAEGRWESACRTSQHDERVQVRRNVGRALAAVGDAPLAPLASELLTDHDADVARSGELALVGMVVRARSAAWSESERNAWARAADDPLWSGVVKAGATPWSAHHLTLLSQAIAQGLNSFDVHRRRGILLAALLLVDRNYLRLHTGSGVVEVIASKGHPSHGALLSLLRARAIPTGRLRALEWLTLPAAQRGALARLSRADSPWDHELVLSAAHLCLSPARRAALASVKAPGKTLHPDAPSTLASPERFPVRVALAEQGPLPAGSVLRSLSPIARRMAPLWAHSIQATSPQRHAALEPLLADGDPLVRMACVRSSVSSLRMDQVLDVDQRVSRSAYLAWIADAEARESVGTSGDDAPRRAEHSRLLALFSRLPHPPVRALATLDRAFDKDPFSPALPAPSVAGVSTAYRRFAENRAAFIDELSAKLSDPSQVGGGWSRAMHLAKRLSLAQDIEHRLREVASREGTSPDLLRNIAQAVTLLGDVATPTSRAALERALSHTDARVRANAVESLAKHARLGVVMELAAEAPTARSRWHGIMELKGDAHHRVRANAVRAALIADIAGTPPARREDAITETKPDTLSIGVESLASMLTDDRTMHRLAGAWLAWKVLPARGPLRLHDRWPEMVARVAEVAQFDTEPKVRARAARCAQLVESSLAAASMHVGGALTLDRGI